MSTVKSGDRVGNYLLEELVGTGSFAQVWRARHHTLDKVVAVKILTDPQYLRNFRQEGVVVHGLRHPNIVRVEDIDAYGEPPYLVMELVNGPSLRPVINAHPQGLPIGACLAIARGVCRALIAAHEAGLIHRDIKPANILLNHSMDDVENIAEQDVKVGDFGLGRAGGTTTASILQSGSVETERGRSIAGTLAYMSPEQKEGKNVDGRADLYATGIVLFEMLTGSRPAGTEMPTSVRPEVPPFLDTVFSRCYTRLERRFESASALLEALRQGGAPRGAEPAGAWHRCPSCHRPVGGGDQFCIHCGYQLVDSVPRCRSCHAFVNRTDRFCIFCGSELHVRSG